MQSLPKQEDQHPQQTEDIPSETNRQEDCESIQSINSQDQASCNVSRSIAPSAILRSNLSPAKSSSPMKSSLRAQSVEKVSKIIINQTYNSINQKHGRNLDEISQNYSS